MFLPLRGSATSSWHSRSSGTSCTSIAGGDELSTRLDVGRDDRRIAVLAPHALEQDRRAGLQLAGAHAAEQHLLVERDHEIGLVAAVGDALRADADADAARAGDAARRRLDLGRDDLDRPDAVAHSRGDRAERLAAALRALAGVADDLDDVLRRIAVSRGSCLGDGSVERSAVSFMVSVRGRRSGSAQATRTRAKLCSCAVDAEQRVSGSPLARA